MPEPTDSTEFPAQQPPGTKHPRFPNLFSPLELGPLTAKNRIVNSAHTTGFARDGFYTEQLIAYHRERARGGAAIIVSQATNVVPDYGELHNVDETVIPWYRRVAEAVHPYGAKYFAELSYPGRQGDYTGPAAEIYYAPSAVPTRPYGEGWRIPHELEPAMIRQIVAAFGAAASRCREGGIDGIELHFAHGNLVQQFMSPATNRRTDAWGGSLENRLRFAREVLEAVRAAIGRDLVVGCRFTGDELDEAGLSQQDLLEIARRLDRLGLLDYLSVTMGHYSDLLDTARNMPDMFFPTALWSSFGAAVKEVVQAPVFVVGRITEPVTAEALLARGHCDMVVLARALIADPELPIKAFNQQEAEIRPCVGAQEGCFGRMHQGRGITCVHNPITGREREWAGSLPPAEQRRRVVVVGAGPAGLECARVAAERGHEVILLERAAEPGGQIRLAARPPQRQELQGIVDYLRQRIEAAGVEVRLGTEASVDAILALRPDAVVVATGSDPGTLDGAVNGGPPVVDARSVLAGGVAVGRRVLVVDENGQRQGFGVADFLASRGHRVELVTPTIYPGQNIESSSWRTTYQHLLEQGVIFHPLTEVAGLHDGQVTTRHVYTKAESTLSGISTVVTALAPVARDTLYRDLQGKLDRLYLIGDAKAPRGIEAAVYEGQEVGRTL